MKSGVIALVSAAALVAGCSHKADTTAETTNTTVTETTTPAGTVVENTTENVQTAAEPAGQTFANGAAASDAFEIASSKLAETNGSATAVKKFAAQMIAAHTESTAKLKSIAATLSPPVVPDASLTAEQQGKLDALRAKKGADFDKEYVADQVAAHEQALAMLQTYSASGDVPAFKEFATGLAPKVSAHLNMAKSLNP